MPGKLNHEVANTELFALFERGDLLYGLSKQRNKVYKDLWDKARGNFTRAHILPDDFNNKILPHFLNRSQASDTMFAVTSSHFHKRLRILPEPYKSHVVFWVALARVPAFAHLALSNNVFSMDTDRFPTMTQRMRRGCRAALLKPGVKKHFLLDGRISGIPLDMDLVFARPNAPFSSTADPHARHFRDSHTAGELRFIVENWPHIQALGLDHLICFYLNSMRVRVEIDPNAIAPCDMLRINQEDLTRACPSFNGTSSSAN